MRILLLVVGLLLLVAPSAAMATTEFRFMMSDRVMVAEGPLRQRVSADPTAGLYGVQQTGAVGIITDGPHIGGGMVWWFVDYEKGVDGWSAQDYLRLVPPPSEHAAQIDVLQKQLLAVLEQINTLLAVRSTAQAATAASATQ